MINYCVEKKTRPEWICQKIFAPKQAAADRKKQSRDLTVYKHTPTFSKQPMGNNLPLYFLIPFKCTHMPGQRSTLSGINNGLFDLVRFQIRCTSTLQGQVVPSLISIRSCKHLRPMQAKHDLLIFRGYFRFWSMKNGERCWP